MSKFGHFEVNEECNYDFPQMAAIVGQSAENIEAGQNYEKMRVTLLLKFLLSQRRKEIKRLSMSVENSELSVLQSLCKNRRVWEK